MLFCLLIGIIDGDGHITLNGSKNSRLISVVSHENWKTFYEKLTSHLGMNSDFKIKKVNKTNSITIKLYKREKILTLFNIAKKYKLPYLKRKWNIIYSN